MKTKLLSMLLAIVLVLGLCPVTAMAEGTDLVMETGHTAEFMADCYLSQIVLKETEGTVSGSEYNWEVVLPADTDTTQPLTVELTGSVLASMAANRYLWADGQVSTLPVSTQNPATFTVTPQWDEYGNATLTVGVGTAEKIVTGYTVKLSLEGATPNPNIIELGETKSKKYFVGTLEVAGAQVASSTVTDTSFSGSTSGHTATANIELAALPEGELTLTLHFMTSDGAYLTANGGSREEAASGVYSYVVDLENSPSCTFVTYSTKGSSTVRGTYTVNFSVVGGALNKAPVLQDGVEEQTEATIRVSESYTVDLGTIFEDPNNDDMTYLVSVDGSEAQETAADYTFVPETAGTYVLQFWAKDGSETSEVSYTVDLTVLSNEAPALTGNDAMTASVRQYEEYTLNLDGLYADADGDSMTYYARVGDGNWKAVSGSAFSYIPPAAGTVTVTVKANDGYVDSQVFTLTLTVEENHPSHVAVIGNTTSNGSFDYIMITDTTGAVIEGVTTEVSETTVSVTLPRTVALDGKIRAAFGLTQNGVSGSVLLPFVSTKNGTAGVASGKAVNNIVTCLDTTLSSGQGAATVYYYNTVPALNSNNPVTYTIQYTIANQAPVLTGDSAGEDSAVAGTAYTMDLAALFRDPDGDALTYQVSVNGETAEAAVDENGIYSYTPAVGQTDTLVFTASDGIYTSEAYTLTLNVSDSEITYDVTFLVPEGLAPVFYPTTGYGDDLVDTFEEANALTAAAGTAENGFVPYTVKVPENVTTVSFRDSVWGGMSIAVSEGVQITLEDFSGYIDHQHDGSYVTAEQAQFLVKDNSGYYAVSGGTAADEELGGMTYYRFLLAATGNDATYTLYAKGIGELADLYSETVQNTFALEPDGQTFAALELTVSDPLTITVPEGAKAKLFRQYNNYNTQEIAPVMEETADGLTVYTFKNPGGFLTWRAWDPTDESRITKAGYVAWNQDAITVTWEDNDPASDTQVSVSDDNTMSKRHDATAVVNVNSQNHLVLAEGGTFRLRGFRWWQIIDSDSNNIMIEPDFTYEILTGSDVISIDAKDGGNASSNWMDITANRTGTAVVEVGFDAIAVSGMSYSDASSFTYGACDPDRTALVVVSVGETTTDVDFGIATYGSSASWDAEFNTLYFLGDHGVLHLTPSVSGTLSISYDKGKTWKALSDTDGAYAVPVFAGGNVLKMETEAGVDYQVVRGEKLSAALSDAAMPGKTVTVSLNGLHHNVSKMSGIYNPGYGGGANVHYTLTKDGTAVSVARGSLGQYQIVSAFAVTIPADAQEGDVYVLTDGYQSCPGMGSGAGAHRSITDSGVGTNTGATTAEYVQGNLPAMLLTVGSDQITMVEEHIFDQEVAEEKYLASAATTEAAATYYKSCLCGEAGTETFSYGTALKEQIAADDIMARMVLKNELNMQFGVPASAMEDWSGVYAVITKEYADRDAKTVTVVLEDCAVVDGMYAIEFAGVAAKEMCDTVTLEVFDADGIAISEQKIDSVKDYALRTLRKSTTGAESKTQLVDMLNYGAAAQVEFTYSTDAPANADLTEEEQALATQTVVTENKLVKGTNYAGSRLVLKNRIELQIGFKSIDSTCRAVYTYTNHYGDAKTVEVAGEDFISVSGLLGVSISQPVVADCRNVITVTVYDAAGETVGYAEDSVESYVNRMSEGGDLYEAIMKFSDSSYAALH